MCFLKEDMKSLSQSSHLVLINSGMDTGGSGTQPWSRARILAVVGGRAGITSLSPRCQVFSVRDLDFLDT